MIPVIDNSTAHRDFVRDAIYIYNLEPPEPLAGIEQKKILQRCGGLFYACNGGAEARRFNRLLIDAGVIKGL